MRPDERRHREKPGQQEHVHRAYTSSEIVTETDFEQSFDASCRPGGFEESRSGGGQIAYSADGVTLSTPSSGEVSLKKTFIDAFSGVTAHEIRFKNNSSASNEFANIMFLNNSSNGEKIVTYAVEGGRLRYNVSGWKTVQYNGKDVYLLDGEWYTLTVVNDYDAKTSAVYLTGERFGNGGKSEVAPLGERVFLGTYDFRNATAGNPDVFEMAIGSGKAGTSFTVDYIRSYAVKEDA